MSEIMIELNNLSKFFGSKKLFSNLNMQIHKQEMVAIVGPSGSGKSTLLNILGLIEPVQSGTLKLLQKQAPKVNSKAARNLMRYEISYLFQNYALIDSASVEKNLAVAQAYTKLSRQEKEEKRHEALKMVGLEGYEKEKVYTLSGGEAQRAAIARAMLKPGSILLADEPTGSLDSKNRENILCLLKQMREMSKTILIVTHDPYVAKQCDKVIDLSSL
jgi:putative ABC transport system ATP-binding protein